MYHHHYYTILTIYPPSHAHDIDAALLLAAMTERMTHAIATMAHQAEEAAVVVEGEGATVEAHLPHHLGTSSEEG